MKLKYQLLLISLVTLTLPWAGCQYIKEMELALRAGQEQTLLATARSLATQIEQDPEMLANKRANTPSIPTSQPALHSIYAIALSRPAIIDGYGNDWEFNTDNIHFYHENNIRISAGTFQDKLTLFLALKDDHIFYSSPQNKDLFKYDGLWLICSHNQKQVTWFIHTEAPGSILVSQVTFNKRGRIIRSSDSRSITGMWQDTVNGYNIELELPLEFCRQGITFLQQNTSKISGEVSSKYLGPLQDRNIALNAFPEGLGSVPSLVTYNDRLEEKISYLSLPNLELSIINSSGWLLSQSKRHNQSKQLQNKHQDIQDSYLHPVENVDSLSFTENVFLTLYLFLLQESHSNHNAIKKIGYRYLPPHGFDALKDKAYAHWIPLSQRRAEVQAVHPIKRNNETLGYLILRQKTDAILSLANKAILNLLNTTFFSMAITIITLLIFSSILSIRIRRLKRTTSQAIGPFGISLNHFPTKTSNDEIGELYKTFKAILVRVSSYTHYLKNLSSKLSHELRTPLAMVNSSIENLKMEGINEQQMIYAERALQGTQRLSNILTAMNEANRVEQSIMNTEADTFDLTQMLNEYLSATTSLFQDSNITTEICESPCMILGSPDLIAQMMDKLLRNAIEFSQGKGIRVELLRQNHHIVINVINQGPLLPKEMGDEIFQSMISVREGEVGTNAGLDGNEVSTPHLGLGLFIVRLITNFHQGQVSAKNLYDDSGVVFTVSLPSL